MMIRKSSFFLHQSLQKSLPSFIIILIITQQRMANLLFKVQQYNNINIYNNLV